MFRFKLILVFIVLVSCKKDDIVDGYSAIYNLPETPFNYSNVQFPPNFNSYVWSLNNTTNNNQLTNAGATLGRVLFYEKKLSINGTIACASCHLQEFGFADGTVKSVGFDGGLTKRNSIGFANAGFYSGVRFF